MPRFERTYRLVIGKAGQQGVEILPPMQISFQCEKTASEQVNVHRVRVYNLKPTTRREIEKPDQVMALYAGYAQEDGPLLMAYGNVLYAYSYREGADVVTDLEVADGYVNLRDTAVTLGYGPGARAGQILADLARQLGVQLLLGPGAPDRTWQHGFSFHGAAHVALHKVVQGTGLEWSIQNGTLQVLARRGVTQRQGIVLAADSGLVDHPERTRRGAREKARVQDQVTMTTKRLESAQQQIDGWRVRSLLLPQVNPGDLVRVESEAVTGWFRADEVRHEGDYAGSGDWVTELQLTDPSTPVANPRKNP